MPSKEDFAQRAKVKAKRAKNLRNREKGQSGVTAAELEVKIQNMVMGIAEAEGKNVSKRKKQKIEERMQEIIPPVVAHESGLPEIQGSLNIDLCEKVQEYWHKGEISLLFQPYMPEIVGTVVEMVRSPLVEPQVRLAACKVGIDAVKNAPPLEAPDKAIKELTPADADILARYASQLKNGTQNELQITT